MKISLAKRNLLDFACTQRVEVELLWYINKINIWMIKKKIRRPTIIRIECVK